MYETALRYYKGGNYGTLVKFGLQQVDDKSPEAGKVKCLTVKAAYKQAWKARQCPEKCEKVEFGIVLFEKFEKAGWTGEERDKAYKYYNRLLNLKQQLTQ